MPLGDLRCFAVVACRSCDEDSESLCAETAWASRSQPVRAFGPVRGCLTRGIGRACSHWSKPGSEALRRTSLDGDEFLHRGARENEDFGTEPLRPEQLALLPYCWQAAADRSRRSARRAQRRNARVCRKEPWAKTVGLSLPTQPTTSPATFPLIASIPTAR